MESSNINSNVTPTMTTASGQRVILNLQTKLPLNGKKEKEFKTTFNTTSSPTLFLNKLQKMTHNQYARKKGKEKVSRDSNNKKHKPNQSPISVNVSAMITTPSQQRVVKEHIDLRLEQPLTGSTKEKDAPMTKINSTPSSKLYECDICFVSLNSTLSLFHHKKIHEDSFTQSQNEPGQIICHQCPTYFNSTPTLASLDELREHENLVHKETNETLKKFACSHCCRAFAHLNELRLHETAVHRTKQNKLACSLGPATFASKDKLREDEEANHEQTHIVLKKIACSFCPMMFESDDKLREHVKTMHDETHAKLKKFACPFCPMIFVSADKLREHEQAIHNHLKTPVAQRKFACSHCPMMYANEDNLRTHEKALHEKTRFCQKKFVCSRCSAMFNSVDQLKEHERAIHRETKPVEKKFPCSQCSSMYASVDKLLVHKVAVHNDIQVLKKNYACRYCTQMFPTEEKLWEHQTAVHRKIFRYTPSGQEIRPAKGRYDCYYCDCDFGSLTKRNEHERQHLNPHKCPHCDAGFQRIQLLKDHIQLHVNAKTCFFCEVPFWKNGRCKKERMVYPDLYACEFCYKVFKCKLAQFSPSEITLSSDPGKCRICHRWFRNQILLRMHEETHAPDAPTANVIVKMETMPVEMPVEMSEEMQEGIKPEEMQEGIKSDKTGIKSEPEYF